jgi:hypothetical protein
MWRKLLQASLVDLDRFRPDLESNPCSPTIVHRRCLKAGKHVGWKAGTLVTKDEIIQMTLHKMGFDGCPLTADENDIKVSLRPP